MFYLKVTWIKIEIEKKLIRNVQILNNDLKRIICTYTYTMKTKQKTIEDTRLIFLYVRRTFHLHRLIYDAQLKKEVSLI